MSSTPLMQALYGLINGSDSPTIRSQLIGNFETFVLNHIPYAQVRPRDLQFGLIELDGPEAPGVDKNKPSLVWHFGGVPHPISKAARLDYYYVRTWDGSGLNVHASIMFGFQPNKALTLSTTPLPHLSFTGFKAATTAEGFIKQVSDTAAAMMKAQPRALVTGIREYTDLDAFLQDQLGAAKVSPATPAVAATGTAPAVAARGFTWNSAAPAPVDIEFDGPARDYDSHQIFAYTGDTLFNDKEKFDQLLWWYFGGKAQRITKAMRIPLTEAADAPSLFVGFTGPGGFP